MRLWFEPSGNYEAARHAVLELNDEMTSAGATVEIGLQEDAGLPPLVLYVAIGGAFTIARAAARVLISWINGKRATIKAISIDGTEVSIEASEDLVRDLLLGEKNKVNRHS